jgi:nicotinate-nucleotide pyrophosphorylase (carboxylating)
LHPIDSKGKAKLLVKENGIIAGVAFAKMIFEFVDPTLQIEILLRTEFGSKRRCRFHVSEVPIYLESRTGRS